MPTKGHEGHDAGKPYGIPENPSHKHDAEHPGYETQDVNVRNISVFIAGLFGCILVFFVVCYVMGKGINWTLNKQDGPLDKWHQQQGSMGVAATGQKLENLKSNSKIEQQQLAQMAQTFPTPRLETDDGNQDIADLHAREDLLLDNYSTTTDGTTRIPISKAMELIVQRGLPKPAGDVTAPKTLMAGETPLQVQAPLTDGFARTGYELDTIEARHQKLEFEKAEK